MLELQLLCMQAEVFISRCVFASFRQQGCPVPAPLAGVGCLDQVPAVSSRYR